MAKRIAWVVATLIVLAAPVGRADTDDVPERAVCQVCAMRGAAHGEEDVAAWRRYAGTLYTFCSSDCAKAFDAFPEAFIPQPLPRPAPDAVMKTVDGDRLEISEMAGKVVLLDFWATWCKPCHESIPLLNRLHETWGDAGLAVLGVSIDEQAAKVVPKFVRKKGVRYPVALDTARLPAWQAFRVAVIPAMFLIDRDGTIVAEWRGTIDAAGVSDAVEALLAGTAAEPAQ